MSQERSKAAAKDTAVRSPFKIALAVFGGAYLVLLHGLVLLYFLPAVTIHKDYINEEQAKLIANGYALEQCLESGDAGEGKCKDELRVSSVEKYEVGVNSSRLNGWSFLYKIQSGEEVVYKVVVGVSIIGRIVDPAEFIKPS